MGLRMTKGAYLFMVAAMTWLALSPVMAQQAGGETGTLRTRIEPSVAGVFIDGQYYGTAGMFSHRSAAIKLPPGKYTVSIVDPRYKELVANVTIEEGKEAVIRERLRPAETAGPPFGELRTQRFGNAAVYIDDKYYGNADEFNGPGQFLLLKPGQHDLRIEPVGGGPTFEKKITIKEDEVTTVTRPMASSKKP